MTKYEKVGLTKEMSKKQKEFIDYLLDNDFKITKVKYTYTQIDLELEKDGITEMYSIPNLAKDLDFHIKTVNKMFKMSKTLKEYNNK